MGVTALAMWAAVAATAVALLAAEPAQHHLFDVLHDTTLALASVLSGVWWLSRPIAPVEECWELGYEAGLREGLRQASRGRRVIELPVRPNEPSKN